MTVCLQYLINCAFVFRYRRSNLFVHCVIIRFLIELSLPIDILSYVFLCCDVMLLFQKKGEGLDPLKRLIPLQMFAPVLSQESDVQ